MTEAVPIVKTCLSADGLSEPTDTRGAKKHAAEDIAAEREQAEPKPRYPASGRAASLCAGRSNERRFLCVTLPRRMWMRGSSAGAGSH